MLSKANVPTFYDVHAYKKLLQSQDLLVDKQGGLRLQGLYEYYSKNGRLKVDNDMLGIGSINDIISGQLLVNIQYDCTALGSIINLIGQNDIYLSSFIKYIIYLSNIQEYKVNSEVNQFSDIFIFINQEWGKLLHSDILNNPGNHHHHHYNYCYCYICI